MTNMTQRDYYRNPENQELAYVEHACYTAGAGIGIAAALIGALLDEPGITLIGNCAAFYGGMKAADIRTGMFDLLLPTYVHDLFFNQDLTPLKDLRRRDKTKRPEARIVERELQRRRQQLANPQ